MQPWAPTLTPQQTRRNGKSLEELGELTAVHGRIAVQDIDGVDIGSGKTNRQRLMEETADVLAQLYLNIRAFDMDLEFIELRVATKSAMMAEWEAHFNAP